MEFLHPKLLWLAVIIPLLAAYYIFIGRRSASLNVSTLGQRRMPLTLRYWLRPLPIVLRLAAIAMLIVALARPVDKSSSREVSVEGIDIALAMDVSTSMLEEDFKPNRLEAAKAMASQFVAQRETDRFALVAFAGEAVTQTPLTANRGGVQKLLREMNVCLVDNLEDLYFGRVNESELIYDGTAIGDGLATALNRLRASDAKSKVVVLLTDGMNNSGMVVPMDAAQIARDMGVKIYTIGVGDQSRYYGYQTIDEELMKNMAKETGGRYFRANDEQALKQIYDQIDKLEKSEVQVEERHYQDELFVSWLILAFILLALEFVVERFILNRLP